MLWSQSEINTAHASNLNSAGIPFQTELHLGKQFDPINGIVKEKTSQLKHLVATIYKSLNLIFRHSKKKQLPRLIELRNLIVSGHNTTGLAKT